ncbi:MAG: L-2-hydroxyglutarate oxidase [Planctomycetes bacterium]|nr:L-2-hydroxyglutarate oxidase [Planctomycetota bacterium]
MIDIAIIGGGIVGLATALDLVQRCRVSLVVLEAEPHIAQHQTGHNSGVIHAGLYYKPGSAKARNCSEGREAMFRFCAEHGIAHERCGKLVVAVDDSELPALEELHRRGLANGLTGIRQLSAAELKEREPHVAGIAGLHVPETGIVDYADVAKKYAELIERAGGTIRVDAAVHAVHRRADALTVRTAQGDIACRHLINCGGLQCDRVAWMCGVDPGVQVVPFRGEYYALVPSKRHWVKHLIYPVPDPRLPFLGVHFTRTVHGEVEAGPNAVLAFCREGYTRWSFSLRDMWDLICFPGFWRMAAKYWRTGISEMWRSFSKRTFHQSLRRLIPELEVDDIQPFGSGVRAQAVEPSGALVDDFRIVESERMIHVLNAPSPAATASLSIGQAIAEMAAKAWGLAPLAA